MASDRKTAELLYEALALKRLPRTGWLFANAPNESLADHSFGTALAALALSRMEGLPEKGEASLLRMALIHDIHEIRTGDLSRRQKDYVKADAKRAERDILSGTYLEGESAFSAKGRLAVLLHDADRLDLLFQAVEAARAGNRNMEPFISFALSEIKSKSGRALAKLAMGCLD